MFGTNNKENKTNDAGSSRPSGSHGLNSVNEGTTLVGDLKAESDIRVDGTIKGNLDCKAKVIIGPNGNIDGEVICENAVIEGGFNGKLVVKDMLQLKETAKVTGEVITRKIAMMAGCDFEGTVTTRSTSATGRANGTPTLSGDRVAALKEKESAAAKS